jgi:hypothetical protein
MVAMMPDNWSQRKQTVQRPVSILGLMLGGQGDSIEISVKGERRCRWQLVGLVTDSFGED